MQIKLKRSYTPLAATAYIATVVVLIQAIATQARIEPRFDARHSMASSPLNLDDPCNRSNAVEIKFCGTGIGSAKTHHRFRQTPSTNVRGRAAGFDSRGTTAGGHDPRTPQALAER